MCTADARRRRQRCEHNVNTQTRIRTALVWNGRPNTIMWFRWRHCENRRRKTFSRNDPGERCLKRISREIHSNAVTLISDSYARRPRISGRQNTRRTHVGPRGTRWRWILVKNNRDGISRFVRKNNRILLLLIVFLRFAHRWSDDDCSILLELPLPPRDVVETNATRPFLD